METWISVNPRKGQKENYGRFARNWIDKAAKDIEKAKPMAFRPEPPPPEKPNGLPKEKPKVNGKLLKQIHKDTERLKREIREKQKQGGKNGQGKT